MFSYFFCDGMKLIQDAIRLPFTWLYVAVIMGLWLVLLSEKPSSTSRVVGQQTAKTVFKLFNVHRHYIWCGGRGVVEIIKRSRGGLN